MNITQIQYALMVAKYRNISNAADALYISQPALSQQIKKLEKDIGFALFQRTGGGLLLTPAGQRFLPYMEKANEAWDNMEEAAMDFRKHSLMHLNIAMSPRVYSNGLFEKIVHYFNIHPDIETTYVTEAGVQYMTGLEEQKIDIVLDRLPIQESAISEMKRVSITPILREKQCILTALPETHPELMQDFPGDTVTIRQLEGQSIVTGLRGSMEDHSMNYLIRKENIHFKRIYRSDSMNTMMELVRQGQGIILGPESFGEYYHVRAIPFTPPKVVDLNFISLRERAEEPAIRDFRKYLLEMAKTER